MIKKTLFLLATSALLSACQLDCSGDNGCRIVFDGTADATYPGSEENEPTVDIEPPVISITNGVDTVETESIILIGTASDNVGVTDIQWSCTSGCAGSGNASGVVMWMTAEIQLGEGENVIEVAARDAANNEAIDTIQLYRQVAAPSTAYIPPVGIPDPDWWPIDDERHPITMSAPDAPADWSIPVDGFYYVNPSAVNATDSGNTFGTPTQPRATIPRTVEAGSYVELHGAYEGEHIVRYECTADEPCWIRGVGQDKSATTRPQFPGRLLVEKSTYLFIENIDFRGGEANAMIISSRFGETHHIMARNLMLIDRAQPGGNSSGISINARAGYLTSNIIIYDSHFESLGDWTVTEDLDFHAILPSINTSNGPSEMRDVWILDNYCTRLSGDCVQVNANNWSDENGVRSYEFLHHIYIGHNESYQNRQAGFGIKQASDVVISQNRSHGYRGNGSANAGAAIGYQYEKANLWIIFNELYDSVYGIRQSATDDGSTDESVFIVGNVIHDIYPAANNTTFDPTNAWHQGTAIALWHGNLDRHVVDNTISGVRDGINAINPGYIDFSGNIVNDIGDENGDYFFTINQPARTDLVIMENNLFFDENRESYFSWYNSNNPNTSGPDIMTNLTQVFETKDFCESCNNSFPSFVDSAAKNFRLNNDSPAKNAGEKHFVYDHFEALYGLDIYVDFDGNPRHPVNPSIGAFE